MKDCGIRCDVIMNAVQFVYDSNKQMIETAVKNLNLVIFWR